MAVKKYWQPGKKRPRGSLRDYGGRSYGNPLFKNHSRGGWSKRKRSKRSIGGLIPWKWIAAAALLALVGYGAWYMIWSDAFKIKQITVSGADSESESWIRSSLEDYMSGHSALVFPNDNSLLFSVSKASERISDAVFFDSLSLRKKLPGELTIEVTERPVAAILATHDNFFALGSEGKIIRRLTEGEIIRLDNLPPELGSADTGALGAETVVVEVESADSTGGIEPEVARLPWPITTIDERGQTRTAVLEAGNEAVATDALGVVMAANQKLSEITGESPLWFTVRPAAETVDVKMSGGWNVYLSTALPFDVQGDRLSLILKEKVGEDKISRLQYVDLRYNEKVFYRFIEDEPTDEDDSGN